ncbi:TonB-dependent receptor [Methylophaga sp.]|uniref:TonB-dependent receptor n=1 Tax=Methylophaga sp. TaxID=2024840 RepID=UPI00271F57E2|nr:TonB-dependent receptor [Methylophaga sp.]MDO8825792.1 TonB-dependent receptor [Methylophaga sp.]
MNSAQSKQAKALKKPTLLNQSIKAAIIATVVVTAALPITTLIAAEATVSQQQQFQIPAGPLAQSLNQFASQARVTLSFDPAITDGLTSPSISGQYSPQQVLEMLLTGTGLQAYRQADEGYGIKATPSVDTSELVHLPSVKVTADAERNLQFEGTAADGYRVKTVSSVGGLGSMNLQDTPFSISVIPKELIENVQASSPDDIYRINPSTRTSTPQSTGWSPLVNIRGFPTYDVSEDGLRRPYNHAAVLEDKERIEVLSGLSGFLYGAAPPAGMINFVSKRPTQERLSNITVGNYGGNQYYVHGDFGGRIDEAENMGYRLNVVRQDGNTVVDDQEIDRTLVSGAFDWQLSDQLLLELKASYNQYKTQAPSAYWFFNDAIPRGKAPDASKNWSQPWIQDEFENKQVGGRLSYQLNDSITLRGGYTKSYIDRPVQDHTMNSMFSTSQYRQLRQRVGETKSEINGGQAFADFAFDTAGIAHKLTLGYYTYTAKDWNTTYAPNTGYQGPYSMDTPTHVPEYSFPENTGQLYLAGKASNDNFMLGDLIQFTPRWSALVGVNHSRITSKNYNSLGYKSQPDYDKFRNSPSISVMFKPIPTVTTYITYNEGLEMGGIAPLGTTNQYEIMPPMVSRQKEIGIKAEVGGVFLTSALFEIEKAYEFANATNTYTQDGRQNHRGAEFSATGKLTERLTIVGGLTLLDPSVRGGDNDGKDPRNVAKKVAKLYSEYALPFVPGLSLTGGAYYTGEQWANNANTYRLPSYTTYDLGLRYTTLTAGKPLTLRLYASNITDKDYWQNSYYVGPPRSIAFSAQMQF